MIPIAFRARPPAWHLLGIIDLLGFTPPGGTVSPIPKGTGTQTGVASSSEGVGSTGVCVDSSAFTPLAPRLSVGQLDTQVWEGSSQGSVLHRGFTPSHANPLTSTPVPHPLDIKIIQHHGNRGRGDNTRDEGDPDDLVLYLDTQDSPSRVVHPHKGAPPTPHLSGHPTPHPGTPTLHADRGSPHNLDIESGLSALSITGDLTLKATPPGHSPGDDQTTRTFLAQDKQMRGDFAKLLSSVDSHTPPSQATTVDEHGDGFWALHDRDPPPQGSTCSAPSPFYYSSSEDEMGSDASSNLLTTNTRFMVEVPLSGSGGRDVEPRGSSTPSTPRQAHLHIPSIREVAFGGVPLAQISSSPPPGLPGRVSAPQRVSHQGHRGSHNPVSHAQVQTVGLTPTRRASTHRGIQTDAPSTLGSWDPPSRADQGTTGTPLFPEGATRPTHARPQPFHCIKIELKLDTNTRLISIPQEDDQESLATSNSVDALLEQVKTLMVDAARYQTRADHLNEMNERDILAPWATTVQPYPPFIQQNGRLLGKIREVRKEAARRVQEIAHAEFDRQATRLQNEGETLIATIDGLMKGKTTPSVNARLEHVASLVGKTKADLTIKLENRREFLAQRQPTTHDWDNFFKYNVAYRRYKINQIQDREFEVSPKDRQQAEQDTAEQVRHILHDDSDCDEPAPTQPRHKKRKRDQPAAAAGAYRIPKKSDHRQGEQAQNHARRGMDRYHSDKRRDHRDSSPATSSRRNQDFGDSRPAAPHKTTYYRTDPEGRRGRDDRQHRGPNRGHNRGPSRPHTHQREDRDQMERDRQLKDLQEQLDRLRRD